MRRGASIVVVSILVGLAAPFGCGADSGPAGPPPDTDAAATGPLRLSETGLYADFLSRKLADGIVRFAPAYPLWADGAEKARYLLLPPGAKVDTRDMNHWVFPVGTKAWKEFRVDGKLVETRLLWKRGETPGVKSWWTMAYVWTADGTDALATIDGTANALGTTHDVPSQEDCTYCHMYVRDTVIGFSVIELSSTASFGGEGGADASADAPDASSGGDTRADKSPLLSFAVKGILSDPPSADVVVPGSGIVRDALTYLHGNCGFCHNEQSEPIIKRTMRLRLLTTDTVPEQTGAYTTTFHAKMRHVMEGGIDEAIVPGDPLRSQLYRRMTATDLMRMPPKATKVVDAAGSSIVRDWILSLPH